MVLNDGLLFLRWGFQSRRIPRDTEILNTLPCRAQNALHCKIHVVCDALFHLGAAVYYPADQKISACDIFRNETLDSSGHRAVSEYIFGFGPVLRHTGSIRCHEIKICADVINPAGF